MLRRVNRTASLAAIAVLLATLTATSASATTDEPESAGSFAGAPHSSTVAVDDVVARVVATDDFDALMKDLTPKERDVAIWAVTPARSETVPTHAPTENLVTSHTRYFYSAANVRLYSVGMHVGWRVSSNPDGWLNDRWVSTHFIGWRFGGWERWAERTIGQGATGIVKMVSQAHMILGSNGIDIQNTYPCVRITGYADWAAGSSSCSL